MSVQLTKVDRVELLSISNPGYEQLIRPQNKAPSASASRQEERP